MFRNIIPPNTDIIKLQDTTLKKINKILANPILLDEDVERIRFKLDCFQKYPRLCVDMDDQLLQQTIKMVNTILTARFHIIGACKKIKINLVKDEYQYSLANYPIPGYCGFDKLPTEIIKYILGFIPFNKRIELNSISKQINNEINNFPIPENYIYPKKLEGMINTKNLNSKTQTKNYTLKQLHARIKRIPESEKLLVVEKAEIHAFNKIDFYDEDPEYRNYKKINDTPRRARLFLAVLVLIAGRGILSLLPSTISYCNEENGRIEKIDLDFIGTSSILFFFMLYVFNEFFSAPSKAKAIVANTTQLFFQKVDSADCIDWDFSSEQTSLQNQFIKKQ